MKKTLIILSHPNIEASRVNKAMIEAIKDLENVTIRNLDKIYGTNIKAFDIQKEQELLLSHDRIVFQFPWYWYSSPAMIKAYQDEVLTYGFAYGSEGDKLNGKEFKIATTIGGADYSYEAGGWNERSIDELLSPFKSMVNLTGMTFTRAFKLYGVAAINDEELQIVVKQYKEKLENQQWDNGLEKYLRKINPENVKAK